MIQMVQEQCQCCTGQPDRDTAQEHQAVQLAVNLTVSVSAVSVSFTGTMIFSMSAFSMPVAVFTVFLFEPVHRQNVRDFLRVLPEASSCCISFSFTFKLI
jgi:hypothetical protein